MSIYEVDRDADALIILSRSSGDDSQDEPPKLSVSPAKAWRLANGTSNHGSPDLRIKVSSKHMSLASRVFRSQYGWGGHDNSDAIQPDGRVHVKLDGFDSTAVKIVLDVIHGRGLRVPKSLDLETLAKVASFVDAFQCYEAVEAYADRWISQLEKSKPISVKSDRELALWVFVAHVFRQPELFRAATRTAISQSTGPIDLFGLPIQNNVIKGIDKQRQELIGKVLSSLQSLVDDLRDGRASCPVGCDAFLLGTLIQALHQWKLSKPYPGISFGAITQAVRDHQTRVWYIGAPTPPKLGEGKERTGAETVTSGAATARFGAHYCGIRSLVNPKLYALEVSIRGLDLKS